MKTVSLLTIPQRNTKLHRWALTSKHAIQNLLLAQSHLAFGRDSGYFSIKGAVAFRTIHGALLA